MEFVDKRYWMSGSRIKFTPIDLCPEFLPSLPHPRAHFELPSEKKALTDKNGAAVSKRQN